MKRLLNTLYVTTPGTYLAREGQNVLVRVEKETLLRVPIHTLGGIVCFGRVSASPGLMALCGEQNVALSFLSEHGRFRARVQGPVSGNVLLRREQYRRADSERASALIARTLVVGKIANARTVLLRAARDHAESTDADALRATAMELARTTDALARPLPLDAVRGKEGEAARAYFAVFDLLITAQKDGFFFRERSRRPPLDNMNALLSFLYTLLTHDVCAALEGADRLALALVNRQQVKARGFRTTESGAVHMDDATRKAVLVAYQKRKQDEVRHPFLDEKMALGLLPHAQAMLLARHLRGDIDGYPPFIWK